MVNPDNSDIAVRLLDGRVLVAGGAANGGSQRTSAELYDPATGTWSVTGSMIHTRGNIPATLLPDGRVLVGDDGNGESYGAELYDPANGTWTATANPSSGGGLATATVLRDGTVLMVGSNGARLFDPGSGAWTATGKMVKPRYDHTAILLPDGRVLVAGGDVAEKWMKSAELYDPQTNSWTATADMPEVGDEMLATLLQDGTVLVVRRGGVAALYDPATGTWTAVATPPDAADFPTSLTRLLDGRVLMIGLPNPKDSLVAEIYDPATGSWTKAGSMLPSSSVDVPSNATLLLDGTVLVTGDSGAQLYVPADVTPPTGLAPVPSPTQTPIPTPTPTPYPPMVGPVPQGARSWTVKVINKRSVPATFALAQEAADGIGPLCGSVTPNVVPASTTENVTFELPPKGVECWVYINPGPGPGGPGFETSNKPMPGHFEVTDGEDPNGGGQGAWVSP